MNFRLYVLLLLLAPGPGGVQAQQTRSLIRFSTESSADWRSGEEPAALRQRNGRAEIALNFRRDDRQLTLTREQRMHLGAFTSFRFRTGVQTPGNLLEGSLSFRSGNGWYVHGFTLHEPGFRHLFFSKSGFKPEGNPSGWDRVDAVRLSFWPRRTGATLLEPLSLEAFVDELWLIDTESLAQGPDETYTSRVTLRHADRLLEGLGLPHAVKTPAELDGGRPKLILIPYLPNLPAESYRQLSRLLDQGSRVIVFESAHQGFASKMGVDLGTAVNSSTVGQFDHWFHSPEAGNEFPSRVFQHAWTFRQIRPLGEAKITARWRDALGRNTGQPAVIESEKGVWANVAWRSGDLDAKQQALGVWIGRLAPALLTESLRYYQETRSPEQFEKKYGTIPAGDGAPSRLKAMAVEYYGLGVLLNSPDRMVNLGNFQKSDQLMQRAYASSQSTWNAEIKGIWDQNGTGIFAGSWDRTCRELKAAGFNAVFSNMASAGRAHYPSRLIPPSKSLEKYGDQLKAFSDAARRHGLQAHAWKICWKLNTRLPAFQEKMSREGRLMRDADGKDIPWLSFSHPENVRFEIESLLEMARHAPLDGIHLDYMRYPGREADYGPAARKAFEARLGRRLPEWPREVLGPLREDYQLFRKQELHRAMQKISEAVAAEFPDLKLSVAVWGAWPDCADAQGQDWPLWAKAGWVDWLVPMNYTDNPDQFEGWLDLQRAQPGVARRLLPGIGMISSNAELSPAEVIRQLRLIQTRNLKGAILYRLDSSLPHRMYPYLKIWDQEN